MERIIDRFDKYMIFSNLNDNKVTVTLGFSTGMLGKSRKIGRDLSKNAVISILDFYTDLDEVWLKTGSGEMIKKMESSNTVQESSPAYKIKCHSCYEKDMEILRLNQELVKVQRKLLELKGETESEGAMDAGVANVG